MRDCEEAQGEGSLLEGGGGRHQGPHLQMHCAENRHCNSTNTTHMSPPASPLWQYVCPLQSFLLSFMKLHWAVITLLVDRGPQGDPRLVLKAVQVCGGRGQGGRVGSRGESRSGSSRGLLA